MDQLACSGLRFIADGKIRRKNWLPFMERYIIHVEAGQR
jgi:hypothetical protein